MPIDFNSNVFFHPIKVVQNKAVNPAFCAKENKGDVFVKNVEVQNTNIDSNYEGISITRKPFGKIQKTGEDTFLYTIKNKNGASIDLSTFGAAVTGIKVPDRDGNMIDVTQGYDNVSPYENAPVGHAGGTIGPCANKINNGTFKLNNTEYQLECNKDNGKTHCHGGSEGLDLKNWKAVKLKDGIKFTYTKKDMESGYPGDVDMSVTYKFGNDNKLHIKYEAKTSKKDTVLNLTNHSYFNLDGAENTSEGSVLDHLVTLPNSSEYTINSKIAVPTGEYVAVADTPFDFTEERRIRDVIDTDDEQLKIGAGFDQNYCVDGYDGKTLIDVARVKSEKTGIVLNVATNLPGFQFYTANHLGKSTQPEGKDGSRYEKRSALCIEPQFFPDAVNKFDEKPILRQGDKYEREIVYSFSTCDD